MQSKREDIIEVTADQLNYFSSNGNKLTLDTITKSIKISKKTIYKLFENKDVLFIESYNFLKIKFKTSIVQLSRNDIDEDQFLTMILRTLCLLNTYRYIGERSKNLHVNIKHEVIEVSNMISEAFFKEEDNDSKMTLRTMLYMLCHHYNELNDTVGSEVLDYKVFIKTFVEMYYSRLKYGKKVSKQSLEEYGLVVPEVC